MGNDGMRTRPVTRAERQFGPAELALLDRDQVRKLCHGLLLAEGASIENYRRTGDIDEYSVSVRSLWRSRVAIVRIYYRSLDQQDLEEVSVMQGATGSDEVLIIATQPVSESLSPPLGIVIISPTDTANRIIGSPLARWTADGPVVAIDRLDLLLRLETSRFLDPVGIQWLAPVAFNELPSALLEAPFEPQDVLEQKCFRLLTASYRFRGERFGESRRGQRLPDAVIDWPDRSACSAIVDCKAASGGYVMEADHLLRFDDYWQTLGPSKDEAGSPLKYLIIVSSHFPGGSRQPHPFTRRAAEVRERTGLELCYVSASDLAWSAAVIEEAEMTIEQRERIDWHSVLSNGVVGSEHLSGAVDAAKV